MVLWQPPQKPLNLNTEHLKTYSDPDLKAAILPKQEEEEDEIQIETADGLDNVTEKNDMEIEIIP